MAPMLVSDILRKAQHAPSSSVCVVNVEAAPCLKSALEQTSADSREVTVEAVPSSVLGAGNPGSVGCEGLLLLALAAVPDPACDVVVEIGSVPDPIPVVSLVDEDGAMAMADSTSKMDIMASKKAEATLTNVVPLYLVPGCELSDDKTVQIAESIEEMEKSSGIDMSGLLKRKPDSGSIPALSSRKALVSMSSILAHRRDSAEAVNDLDLLAEVDEALENDGPWGNDSGNGGSQSRDDFLAPDSDFWATVAEGGDNPSKTADKWAIKWLNHFRESRNLSTAKSLNRQQRQMVNCTQLGLTTICSLLSTGF
jgi:hypothetical protein